MKKPLLSGVLLLDELRRNGAELTQDAKGGIKEIDLRPPALDQQTKDVDAGLALLQHLPGMKPQTPKRGRPPKGADRVKADYLDIRLGADEKQAFKDAAALAGLDLSAWVRERLRSVARKELESAEMPVAFMQRSSNSARGTERG